jgi:hypothetical protein
MNTKHTKGEWLIRDSEMMTFTNGVHRTKTIYHNHNEWGGNETIAVVMGNPSGNLEANAKLIAAAPELLEGLKKCVRIFSSIYPPELPADHWLEQIKQVIKKATL